VKILIAGGRGFIGSATAARLRELGHEVVQTGRADTASTVSAAAASGGFDALVWGAGGRPISLEQCVADHAHAAVRTARSLPGLKKVVYLSSAEVYGLQDVPFREDMPLLGASPLGQAKIAGEHGIVGAAPDARVTILRPCWVYGAGLAPSTFLPTLVASLAARRRYPMTPGMQTRDLIYIDDMVRAIVRALDDDAPAGVFNIGTGRETPILDMALLIAERVRDTAALLLDVGARPYREGEAFRVAIDVGRANDVLGFTATTTLEDGLTRMVEALVPSDD
jgi:nucleoside-diphosphate-sugar epimerase